MDTKVAIIGRLSSMLNEVMDKLFKTQAELKSLKDENRRLRHTNTGLMERLNNANEQIEQLDRQLAQALREPQLIKGD